MYKSVDQQWILHTCNYRGFNYLFYSLFLVSGKFDIFSSVEMLIQNFIKFFFLIFYGRTWSFDA